MGKVLAAYGVHAWLKARAFTESPAALLAYRTWWLGKDAQWREFAVIEARQHSDSIVALLDGFAVREDVAPWRGASIAVPRDALPPAGAGEVYLADLVGLSVVNRQNAALGRVTGVIETGAHPVLRVAGETVGMSERLIPLVPAYVDTIELASGRIVVDWPSDY
jgi:16S rRNA processing protein RimM